MLVSDISKHMRNWKEPIYRDVWGLNYEFGDAELASLIAPRALIVEACQSPEVPGPPPGTGGTQGVRLSQWENPNTPPLVGEKEIARARTFFAGLKAEAKLQLVASQTATDYRGPRRRFMPSFGLSTEAPSYSPREAPRQRSQGGGFDTPAAPAIQPAGGFYAGVDPEVTRSSKGVLEQSRRLFARTLEEYNKVLSRLHLG